MTTNIIVCVPAKAGSTFIGILIRKIVRSTKWTIDDNGSENVVLGPIRERIPLVDEWKYIVHLRDPLDHLISIYHSMTWDHPYMGPANREFQYTILRSKLRPMTIDEFCFWYLKDYIPLVEEFINIGRRHNSIFLTYEDMWNNFDYWITNFLKPFNIPQSKADEIIKKQLEQCHKEPRNIIESKPKLRYGEPGEHQKVLKESTIDMLRYELRHIIKFMNHVGSGDFKY